MMLQTSCPTRRPMQPALLCFAWRKTETLYMLPQRSGAQVTRQPDGYVWLLPRREYQKNRLEVYELLIREIGSALSRRTESSD